MAYNHMYMAMDYGRQPAAEYRALTEGVTLWDVGAERQVELAGPDALRFADLLATRDLSQLVPGACRYTLIADENGIVICDPVVLYVEEGRVWLSHGNVDLLLWAKGVALGAGLDVTVREADVAPMQLQGPLARTVLEPLVGDALEGLGYYRLTHAEIAGVPCVVSRTGWSGGPGYEIFPLGSERALEVWDAVEAAGTPLGLLIVGPERAARARARHLRHRLVPQPRRERARGGRAARRPRRGRLHRPRRAARRARGRHQAPHRRLRRARRRAAPRRRHLAADARWRSGRRDPLGDALTDAGRASSASASSTREHADEGTELALVAPGGDVPLEVAPLPFVPAPPGTND